MNVTALCDKLPLSTEPPMTLPVEGPLGRRGVVHLISNNDSDKGRVFLVWDDRERGPIFFTPLFTWDGPGIIWPEATQDNLAQLELIATLSFVDVWVEGWDEDPFDLGEAPTAPLLTPSETFERLYGGRP